MPTYGENQIPAGVDISPARKKLGKRTMVSKDTTIQPSLTIDNIPYEGNAVLNANK